MVDTILKRDAAGKVWAHRIKKNGQVSQAGNMIDESDAAQRVADGEAQWAGSGQARRNSPRISHERHVQQMADDGHPIEVRDWDAAMNRDD